MSNVPKISLKEKLRLAKAKKVETPEVITDQKFIQPTVPELPPFSAEPTNVRVEKQRKSRKINPKDLIVSKPQLKNSKEMEPRLLTSDEINEILLGIPIPIKIAPENLKILTRNGTLQRPRINYSSDPEISMLMYNEIVDHHRIILAEMYLTPLAIPDFKNYMTIQFNIAKSEPGSKPGISSGDAITAPVIQGTMNSFHQSGILKTVSYGIKYIEELIDATGKPGGSQRKQLTNTIHFKNKYLTFSQVLEYRRKIVEVTIGDIIKDYEILPVNELQVSTWYQTYLKLLPTDLGKYGLRLYLNTQHIFDYRINISEIRDALIKERPSLINIVISPTFAGIVDIYPIEANLGQAFESEMGKGTQIDPNYTSIIFLQNLIIPQLDKIKIKGIEKIDNLFPVAVPIWSTIKNIQKITEQKWNLIYDSKVLKLFNLKINRTIELLEELKFQIIERYSDHIIVNLPDDYKTIVPGKILNPNEYVNSKLDADKENLKISYENLKEHVSAFAPYPTSQLAKLSTYYMAETNGANMEALFEIRELDHNIMISNDIHDTRRILGIEGARNLLIKDFIDYLNAQGSGVDPRHIILISDFMTNKGEYLGFTKSGIDQQETSTHEQASFERATETFFNSAVFGERVPVSSVTQSVFVGAPAGFGTNYNRVMIHEEKRKEYKDKVSKISKISVAEAETGMDVFNDINFAGPSLYFGDSEFDRAPTNLLISNPQNPGGPVLANYSKPIAEKVGGLPLDRKTLNLNLASNVKISIPSKYTGNLNPEVKITPEPIVSDLVKSSVSRIPGIPRLDQDVPYQIPLKSGDFVGTNANVELKGVPTIKGVPRLKLGMPKVLAIPKPGGADIVPISGLTDSKISGIPITPVIPKGPIKGIPRFNSKPEAKEVEGGGINNLNPTVPTIAKPIDLDAFLNEYE